MRPRPVLCLNEHEHRDRAVAEARAAARLRDRRAAAGPRGLRWHTAACLLARVALPAVSRYRPRLLDRTRALLEAVA